MASGMISIVKKKLALLAKFQRLRFLFLEDFALEVPSMLTMVGLETLVQILKYTISEV